MAERVPAVMLCAEFNGDAKEGNSRFFGVTGPGKGCHFPSCVKMSSNGNGGQKGSGHPSSKKRLGDGCHAARRDPHRRRARGG